MRHISATRLARPDGARPGGGGVQGPSKWALLDRLAEARQAFGLKPPQLAVLRALLSFHPGDRLPPHGPAVVFPSNRTLSERLHGMPESTLRRHLARLAEVGAIARRDSPNRKRFALRGRTPLAFGFDLAPLVALAPRIAVEADAERERASWIKTLRMRIRSALGRLVEAGLGGDRVAEMFRLLRRRVAAVELEAALEPLEAREAALPLKTAVAAAHIERPLQSHEKEPEAERSHEAKSEADPHGHRQSESLMAAMSREAGTADLSLDDVIRACPDLTDYGDGPVTSWRSFAEAGHRAALALGIRAASWRQASARLGPVWAAGATGLMLRRAGRIERPDAYFRALLQRAVSGLLDLPTALAGEAAS